MNPQLHSIIDTAIHKPDKSLCLDLGAYECPLTKNDLIDIERESDKLIGITQLSFAHQPLAWPGAAEHVIQLVRNFKHVECLNLHDTGLDLHRFGGSIVDQLPLSTLKILDLSGNEMGKTGAYALTDAASNLPNLSCLNLDWNNIGDSGVIAIADAAHSFTSLSCLHLRFNGITNNGAASIVKAASRHPWKSRLTRLYLMDNPLQVTENVLYNDNAVSWVSYFNGIFSVN